jgi:hypothetical protein
MVQLGHASHAAYGRLAYYDVHSYALGNAVGTAELPRWRPVCGE